MAVPIQHALHSADPWHEYRTDLEQQKVTFSFRWQERNKSWYLDMFDGSRNRLHCGLAIREGTNLVRYLTQFGFLSYLDLDTNERTQMTRIFYITNDDVQNILNGVAAALRGDL